MKRKFEQIVELEPAFDKRHSDPSKNYGIHCVTLRMVLKGPEGAVQFVLYTGWFLPKVQEELERKGSHISLRPMPCDLGYHSPKPMYEGHEPMGSEDYSTWREPTEEEKAMGLNCKMPDPKPTGTFTPCDLVGGGPCYYDGSGLNAERIYKVLLTKGHKGVWKELEKYYKDVFLSKEEEHACV